MQLTYKVHGGSKSIAADGMGLFLAKERTTFGSAIGGPEKFTGMAILLDSYRNAQTSSPFPQVFKVSKFFIFGQFINDNQGNF